MSYLFTSESVTEGHPDKVCDKISDAILDELIRQDPKAHVAVETMVTTGLIVVSGEISTKGYADVQSIIRKTIKEIGYTKPQYQFDHLGSGVLVGIHEQSLDIAQGVDETNLEDIGAGDQGIMFGYASDETKELMPLPILLANKLTQKMSQLRKDGIISYLRPDGKAQITVQYSDDHVPQKVTTVVIAQQHDDKTAQGVQINSDMIKKDMIEHAIKPILGKYYSKDTNVIINGTGRFVIGGPASDTGMTGRKIIVDTYGGMAPHGGGAFSGKDPTKVDRSASYMARYIAKNIVGAKLAKRCTVQLGYVIGKSEPVSVWVDTHGTGAISNDKLILIIKSTFRLKPGQIIEDLKLRKPIYSKTASYGHFGREDVDFSWEKLDKVDVLKKSTRA